jgi:RimJ/RimL family protein N-acetyltransferase
MSFNFNQDLVLEDERVLLRALQNSDVEHLLEISLNEPETWEYSLVKRKRKLDPLLISYSGREKIKRNFLL